MEESSQASTSASSSESIPNGEHSGAASISSTNSQVQEEEQEEAAAGAEEAEHRDHWHPQIIQQRTSVSYSGRFSATENYRRLQFMGDDSWSCIIVVLTFWFFVSMTMILGVYGSVNLLLGPNSSILIEPSPLFVEHVKVEKLEEAAYQPMLFGLYKDPPLDVVTTWSETHKVTLPSSTHEEWVYFLNEGSQINVSYTVNSSTSSSIVLSLIHI